MDLKNTEYIRGYKAAERKYFGSSGVEKEIQGLRVANKRLIKSNEILLREDERRIEDWRLLQTQYENLQESFYKLVQFCRSEGKQIILRDVDSVKVD